MKRGWSRQKKEIDAYNTFISSYHSRASYHGFSERGYVLTNYFPTIEDQYSNTTAEPDFILYNGNTFIQVEIKNSDNFEPRHKEQLERCTEITIQKAEEFLGKSEVGRRYGFDGDVYSVESCIVYQGINEEYIKKCRSEWENCREHLEEIEEVAPVLGQQTGGRLRILAGEFESDDLQHWLNYGISLPDNPRTTVSLTDGMELESIAVALCTNWGQKAVSDKVSVTVRQVRQHFDHRELPPARINNAFRYLTDLGICEETSEREYTFSPEDLDDILNIERIISERDQNRGNSGLDKFTS